MQQPDEDLTFRLPQASHRHHRSKLEEKQKEIGHESLGPQLVSLHTQTHTHTEVLQEVLTLSRTLVGTLSVMGVRMNPGRTVLQRMPYLGKGNGGGGGAALALLSLTEETPTVRPLRTTALTLIEAFVLASPTNGSLLKQTPWSTGSPRLMTVHLATKVTMALEKSIFHTYDACGHVIKI